ncbi:unnamed protein product [Auanema sp. JU1783]|nr:unnamed protein product [Auanema sp. JU1783]
MEEPQSSPAFNFRRTQSCRVTTKSSNGFSRRGSRVSRSKSQRRGAMGSISSLSFSQKQALAMSWRLMRPQAGATFRKILLELEIASPKVKQIFYKAALVDAFNKEEENVATLEAHTKLLIRFFDELLTILDDEAECIERIKRIGSSHAILAKTCSFSSDIWERLGEIAMERICTHESVQKTREAARAWRTLIACLTDELRTGFDGEARHHRKSSSTEHLEEEREDTIHSKVRQLRLDCEQMVPFD